MVGDEIEYLCCADGGLDTAVGTTLGICLFIKLDDLNMQTVQGKRIAVDNPILRVKGNGILLRQEYQS